MGNGGYARERERERIVIPNIRAGKEHILSMSVFMAARWYREKGSMHAYHWIKYETKKTHHCHWWWHYIVMWCCCCCRRAHGCCLYSPSSACIDSNTCAKWINTAYNLHTLPMCYRCCRCRCCCCCCSDCVSVSFVLCLFFSLLLPSQFVF